MLSLASIKAYEYDLTHYKKQNGENFSKQKITEYLNNYSGNTKNRKIAALKSHLGERNDIFAGQREKIKHCGNLDMGDKEVFWFLQAVYNSNRLRDIAIFDVWFVTGLRVAEMAQVEVSKIDWGNRLLNIMGKGGYTRKVPYDIRAEESLHKYFVGQKNTVFLSQKGERVSIRGLQHLCNKYGGISPVHIRRTVATRLELSGIPRNLLRMFLGHFGGDVTDIYINYDRLPVFPDNFFECFPVREYYGRGNI